MPLVDSDTVVIRTTTHEGTAQAPKRIRITFDWTDSQGVNHGRFSMEWATFEELTQFLGAQDEQDIGRAIMSQCIAKSDGSFRRAKFTGLAGTTNTILQRVQQQ